MLTGTLIMESLRPGTALDTSALTFTALRCVEIEHPAPGQPARWVLGDFTATTADPDVLAQGLADVLDHPGWYADFRDETWHWVAFENRVFRYRRDDPIGRAAAVQYGLGQGVPMEQLDWGD